MQRSTCRNVVLAIVGLVGCTGDPTGDLRGGLDHLIATPSAIFIGSAGSTNVTVEAVDAQGNRQATRFTLASVGSGITVRRDSTFDLVYDAAGNLVLPEEATRVRFIVAPAAASGSTSFEVTAGGRRLTIPVRLLPDSAAGAFSNAAPSAGDTVTFTTTAPFQFRPTATVTAGGRPAILIGQTPTALRFVPLPGGASGPVTVNGVALDYATTLSLSLPSVAALTVPAGKAGVGALATAPAFPIPAAGNATLFVDAGEMFPVTECQDDFGSDCRVYQLTLATARSFGLRATWEGTEDLGLYFYNAAGTLLGGGCDAKGDGAGGQPESCTKTLGPGTFYMAAVNFSGAVPAWIRIDVTGN